MSTNKARYFTFLLCPEGIPENWEMELKLMDIPMAISPLRDKGRSNVGGQEYRKTHYHVIYVAASPVTTHNVRKKIQRALGNKSIAKVQVVKQSMENMCLYLTHGSKDATARNKYKYAKRDIELLGSSDIDRYVVLDIEDKEEMLNDVCDMIDDHGLVNIRELRRFVKEHRSDHNLPGVKIIDNVLRLYIGLIRLYLDAVYQERKYGQSYVDMHTGEVEK